eukprot:15446601-Alexandrium_andersonii.AAC.1
MQATCDPSYAARKEWLEVSRDIRRHGARHGRMRPRRNALGAAHTRDGACGQGREARAKRKAAWPNDACKRVPASPCTTQPQQPQVLPTSV